MTTVPTRKWYGIQRAARVDAYTDASYTRGRGGAAVYICGTTGAVGGGGGGGDQRGLPRADRTSSNSIKDAAAPGGEGADERGEGADERGETADETVGDGAYVLPEIELCAPVPLRPLKKTAVAAAAADLHRPPSSIVAAEAATGSSAPEPKKTTVFVASVEAATAQTATAAATAAPSGARTPGGGGDGAENGENRSGHGATTTTTTATRAKKKPRRLDSTRSELYALLLAAWTIRTRPGLFAATTRYEIHTDCMPARYLCNWVCRFDRAPSRMLCEQPQRLAAAAACREMQVASGDDTTHPSNVLLNARAVERDVDVLDEWWYWTRGVRVTVHWVPGHEQSACDVARRIAAPLASAELDFRGNQRADLLASVARSDAFLRDRRASFADCPLQGAPTRRRRSTVREADGDVYGEEVRVEAPGDDDDDDGARDRLLDENDSATEPLGPTLTAWVDPSSARREALKKNSSPPSAPPQTPTSLSPSSSTSEKRLPPSALRRNTLVASVHSPPTSSPPPPPPPPPPLVPLGFLEDRRHVRSAASPGVLGAPFSKSPRQSTDTLRVTPPPPPPPMLSPPPPQFQRNACDRQQEQQQPLPPPPPHFRFDSRLHRDERPSSLSTQTWAPRRDQGLGVRDERVGHRSPEHAHSSLRQAHNESAGTREPTGGARDRRRGENWHPNVSSPPPPPDARVRRRDSHGDETAQIDRDAVRRRWSPDLSATRIRRDTNRGHDRPPPSPSPSPPPLSQKRAATHRDSAVSEDERRGTQAIPEFAQDSRDERAHKRYRRQQQQHRYHHATNFSPPLSRVR